MIKDWLFPEAVTNDIKRYTKAKILVFSLMILVSSTMLVYGLNNVIDLRSEFPFKAMTALFVFVYFVFRKTASFTIAGNLLALCLFIVLATVSLKSGGIYSIDTATIYLIPIITFVIAGYRSTIFWIGACTAWGIYLFVISSVPTQAIMFREQTLMFGTSYYLFIIIINLVFAFIILSIFQYQNSQLMKVLEESKASLEKRNAAYALQTKQLETTEELLLQSNDELKQFAHATSHDLKQPIRSINGFANLLNRHLSRKKWVDETTKEYGGLILKSTKNMAKLVDDSLAYAKLTSEKKLSFVETSLDEVFENVLLSLQKQIEENEVTIIRSPLPPINAVPIKVTQVFQNIISNAIKFKQKESDLNLIISCQDLGSSWQIRIQDNGIGIQEEYLEKIFQPFKRLNNKDEYEGSGIGLATCKRIIEMHNGEIFVKSTLGKGSTFYLAFPKLEQDVSSNDSQLKPKRSTTN